MGLGWWVFRFGFGFGLGFLLGLGLGLGLGSGFESQLETSRSPEGLRAKVTESLGLPRAFFLGSLERRSTAAETPLMLKEAIGSAVEVPSASR